METIKQLKKEIQDWKKAIPLFKQVDSCLPHIKINELNCRINQIKTKTK